MNIWNLAIRIIFLSQTILGILGNLSLMFYYLVLYYRECTLKPTDLILMHLMTANALVILSVGVPQTMAVWGMKHFLKGFGCELLLYIQGFARSVSIGTTCLLSVFQAMTISPRKSCWNDHKVKAAKYIDSHISLLWVFYMLIRFIFFMYTFIKMNIKNMTRNRDFEYCSTVGWDEIINSLYAALVMCPEFFFTVLITWSSTSMIIILYRHKQRVQHIRSSHGSSRNSPESRATQNILVLVCIFLAFYTLSTILRGYIALLYKQNWWLVNISHLTSLCFPCFIPFVLMRHHSIFSTSSVVSLRKFFS
ncbi:vomeronasal type-1 receptor 4-like [Peromyscus maniculatus bairdii]|uniref:vomeronasal type-1 receptor 4-like n=1 Tax=Peromyscus maniculatus bairdii TaxID=230844 RepID=UPI00077DEDD8|nr:vomeronasal type-1 receptor 4-like [Peromyscus maniculatus bairdii]